MVLVIMAASMANAQVGINTDNSAPDASAGLDVKFSDRGVLLPRVTFDQRSAIAGPAEGLMVFCTDCTAGGSLCIFSNGAWRAFTECNTPSTSPAANAVSPGQVTWNWTAVAGAAGYKWNTTPNYSSAVDMSTAISKTETGLSCGETYTRYVWVYSECGLSLPVPLSQAIPVVFPVSPSAGTHIPGVATIAWNWYRVAGATGYRWNTTDDYATATDMGTDTTFSESGLACGTDYTRFVWTNNVCGPSASTALTQVTLGCPVACGSDFTISHQVAGGVAPVNKTVTYGTVNGIPGEPAKCWITRNLGASQQPAAVNNNTEAPAGWYFQFNHKQGFQYINSRIPATTWISVIGGSSDWTTANDPCSLELGLGWRIPTMTEWTNIDASGNWTDWNGPFGSALKLHAAGNLSYHEGTLAQRGINGNYWSSTQDSADEGKYLDFDHLSSALTHAKKAYGYSLRCIRDN